MTKLFLVRHGETDYNKRGLYYGFTDVTLNEKGYTQAKNLKAEFGSISFDEVITSTLKRAIDSACIITNLKEDKLHKYEELKEINFGLWEGQNYKFIQENYKEEWKLWSEDFVNYTLPQGESYIEFFGRVKQCIEKILISNKNKTILLVAHQGVLRVISIVLLSMSHNDYYKFDFKAGLYSLYEIYEDNIVIKKINGGNYIE